MPHLPFTIDKASGKGLVELTIAGIRRAILDGAYVVDEVLPTQDEMAKALGVSIRVTREALAKLAEEGLVSARGRRGTVVLPLKTRKWKGRIVYLHSPYVGSYHFARFGETLAAELTARPSPCHCQLTQRINLLMPLLRRIAVTPTWFWCVDVPTMLLRRSMPVAFRGSLWWIRRTAISRTARALRRLC